MFYFLIASYLVGSISSAIIICKIFSLPDPRTEGSKNPGATNVLRIGGRKLAAFVLLFDGFKGAMPVVIGHYLEFSLIELTVILLCFFVGLTFSIIWLIVAKVIKVSSIAALTATLLSPIYFYFIITSHNLQATLIIFLINLFIYFTHRANIKRIMNGEEEVIKF